MKCYWLLVAGICLDCAKNVFIAIKQNLCTFCQLSAAYKVPALFASRQLPAASSIYYKIQFKF